MHSTKMKFALIGFVIGILFGAWPAVYAYIKTPEIPCPYELGIQLLIIGLSGTVGTVLGFLTGFMIDLFRKIKVVNQN